MEANNLDLKEIFLSKQEILDNAKKVLKQEFIGIDKIIDEIIDNVSSWFFLPHLQEKPVA
jgi:cell division protease FtsH